MTTPIEPFYPQMWDLEDALVNENPIVPPKQLEALPFYYEPYEDAMNVVIISEHQNVQPVILEPTQQLHPTPPGQQHSISKQGIHLLDCDDPIKLLDAIFPPYQFRTILHQPKLYRKQSKFDQSIRLESHPMKRSGALLALSYGDPLFNCPIVAATSLTRRYSIHHISNSIPPIIDLRDY